MQSPDFEALYGADARRGNRRRLLVFLGVLLASLAIGLAWVFVRPAEYRSTARMHIEPPVLAVEESGAGRSGGEQAFLTEVQTLGSRPLLERVAATLRTAGHEVDSLGLDPVLALQSTLKITAVPGTQVVELEAIGRTPELPAALLAGIAEAYREHIARTFRDSTDDAAARASDEASRLEAAVAAKRREAEEFRVRSGIVSPERDENSVLAEIQGLAAAQKDANKRLAEAEGRAVALRAAAATGKGAVRAADGPDLAALETRAAQLREELRELARRYTPNYLDADPNARALRSRLAEIESQVKVRREVGQRLALEEAEQELDAARESSKRLQQQIEASRRQAGEFAARFGQYKALQDELAQLQRAYQDALQRQARLGASEPSRRPALQIVEAAAIPREPWRPLYWRDAGIVAGASLALALAVMWLVELFNRPAPRPSVLIAQPVWAGALPAGSRPPELGGADSAARLPVADRARLAGPATLPRELTVEECAALLRAADAETAQALTLLLSGVSPAEALALRWRDVGADSIEVRSGAQARQVPILRDVLAAPGGVAAGDDLVLRGSAGDGPMAEQELAARLLVAAHDAGLEQAHEVTADALRHTYIAFLLRQGARFADITRWVGAIDSGALAAYSQLAPGGQRLEAVAIRRVFPALGASAVS